MPHYRPSPPLPDSRTQAGTLHGLRFVLTLGALGLAACGDSAAPTQPDTPGGAAPVLSLAAARNSWTLRAPPPFVEEFHGFDLGMAPNSAGQSIVYTFGGTDGEGGTGFTVKAYNVATDTWTGGSNDARVGVFDLNGVGKLGSKLYYSGGSNDAGAVPNYVNQLWAYDYAHDRLIRKADMPIVSGQGLTGVINGKLYVLPGVCSADLYPQPGYCAEEQTRRFFRYDPATNSWVSRRQSPHYHWGGIAGAIDGRFYVAGGKTSEFGQDVTALDVYDPATNTWTPLAPIPTGGAGSGAVLGGQLYAFVEHFNGTTPEIRGYAYNPTTNQWKAKAAPAFLGPMTRVTLDGGARLLMVTGDQTALYTP